METKFLFLWLEAPLQSWGFDSKFGRRDTQKFPTKSGILGLLLCALGASGEQTELLARFALLKQTVVSYKKIKFIKVSQNSSVKEIELPKEPLLRDFQMIGSGYDTDDLWQNLLVPKTADGKLAVGGGTKITHRYYLQDATFAVVMEIPSDMADKIAESLKNPVYDIYLGRKCCVPTDFVFQGVFDSEEEALDKVGEKVESKVTEKFRLSEEFRVYDANRPDIDCEEGNVFTLNDIPVQFGTIKKYRDRRVVVIETN